MRWHTVDYRERRNERGLVNRGFWLYDVPRVTLLCRLFGHRAVVDGTNGRQPYRWVTCDRCGLRPEPQGNLDAQAWAVGQRFTGPMPGPWPKARGTIGGQLVIGKPLGTAVEFKLGNAGSEQVLSGHVSIWPLGALYLHAEQHGKWLQRRLNSTGYESRVTGFSAHGGHLYWRLWAKRNSWSSTDPKWQQGSFRIDPRDIALGERRYSYENVGESVVGTVRMPHGDDHEVILQLQSQSLGRKRGRIKRSWSVDWDCRAGIATKPGDHGHVCGSGVTVPQAAVENGSWTFAALSAIAADLTNSRTRYGFTSVPTSA